jgi:RimJ/RimL family protein N-acetyltransferase
MDDQRIVLANGAAVDVVPIEPADAERLLQFHRRLSAETIRRRFFSIHPELSPDELHRFTNVDHLDREAFVAVADGEIVAVGRFDRAPDASDAEVAFVVADGWQGRGVGTALLRRVISRARQVGVRRLVAQTLSGNQAMLAVFRHSGCTVRERAAQGVVDVTIDLDGV